MVERRHAVDINTRLTTLAEAHNAASRIISTSSFHLVSSARVTPRPINLRAACAPMHICHKRSRADRQRPTTRAQVVRPTRPSLVHRQKDRIDPVRRCSRLGVQHRARWRVAVLERPLEEPRTPTAGTRPTGGLRAPRGALPDAPGPKGRRRAQQQPRRRLSFSALRHLSYAVRAACGVSLGELAACAGAAAEKSPRVPRAGACLRVHS